MKLEEIAPHFNKLAMLYLSNKKRKVGWLFLTEKDWDENNPAGEVYFVTVQNGKILRRSEEEKDLSLLERVREAIPIMDIVRIRSSK